MYKKDRVEELRTMWEDWEHAHDLFRKLSIIIDCTVCPVSAFCDSHLDITCEDCLKMYAKGDINGN